MPNLKINQPYTPAQQRTIRLAFEQGLISDKEQARIEGLSPRSITDRWDGIAHRLRLAYGQRDRARVLVELIVRKHIEILLLVVAILTSVSGYTQPMRPRPPGSARTAITMPRQSCARKPGQDGGMAGLNTWGIAA